MISEKSLGSICNFTNASGKFSSPIPNFRNAKEFYYSLNFLHIYPPRVDLSGLEEPVCLLWIKEVIFLTYKLFYRLEGIEAADIAIAENSLDRVYAHLSEEQIPKIKDYFAEVQSKKNYDVKDVKAGREFVAVYVHSIH